MRNWKDELFVNLMSSFRLGYSPIASGTVGSLPAVLIYVLIWGLAPTDLHTALIGGALLISCVLCVALGPWAERYWGKKDPRQCVLDEWAGFFLTVLLFRVPSLLLTVVWTFLMTRIFDILKPPPANRLQSLPHGWGILVDDLMASLYAAAALHLLAVCFPWLFTM